MRKSSRRARTPVRAGDLGEDHGISEEGAEGDRRGEATPAGRGACGRRDRCRRIVKSEVDGRPDATEGATAPRVTQPDVASKGFANERPSPEGSRGGRRQELSPRRAQTIGAEAAAARTQRAPAPRVPRPQRPSTAPPKRPATAVAPVGPPLLPARPARDGTLSGGRGL